MIYNRLDLNLEMILISCATRPPSCLVVSLHQSPITLIFGNSILLIIAPSENKTEKWVSICYLFSLSDKMSNTQNAQKVTHSKTFIISSFASSHSSRKLPSNNTKKNHTKIPSNYPSLYYYLAQNFCFLSGINLRKQDIFKMPFLVVLKQQVIVSSALHPFFPSANTEVKVYLLWPT